MAKPFSTAGTMARTPSRFAASISAAVTATRAVMPFSLRPMERIACSIAIARSNTAADSVSGVRAACGT